MGGYGSSIVGELDRAARRFPDRTAIIHGDNRLTYAGLWKQVASWAAWLLEQGVRPADRVALILENSADYVAAYYGALAAGAVAVPLNAAAKARDLSVWLEHADACCLFIASSHPELAKIEQTHGGRLKIIRIDAASTNAARPAERARPPLDSKTPACILYTSGTTGAPKGVLLTHGNLAANSTAIVHYLKLTHEDSIVCILPFYYSYGSSVLHTHLQAGACIVIETNLVYPHAVLAGIAHHRATGFAGVPSTFALLLNRVQMENFDLSSLRYVTQAGGPMSSHLAQRLRQALPAAQLFIMYGQTEATARLTYLPPADLDRKLGSVGMPIEGVSLEIRSEDGKVCGPLQSGEVWVKGPNVMAEYWRDPQATAAVLRDGWLRTGDDGYLDEDGYLFLAGRRGDMIKAGAHRIHPKDIEETIQEMEEVAEAAVVGIDDEILGQAIKAFIVPAPGRSVDPLKVKAHCRERLAGYKVPKSIEIVASLPKTASGKIRRIELVKGVQT